MLYRGYLLAFRADPYITFFALEFTFSGFEAELNLILSTERRDVLFGDVISSTGVFLPCLTNDEVHVLSFTMGVMNLFFG